MIEEDACDRERLTRLVGPDLMVEWRRRLDDFDAKGWHNAVEVRRGPDVEYVGLVNRDDDTEDRVVVRVTAEMRDVVERGDGIVIKKKGSETEIVSLATSRYWLGSFRVIQIDSGMSAAVIGEFGPSYLPGNCAFSLSKASSWDS